MVTHGFQNLEIDVQLQASDPYPLSHPLAKRLFIKDYPLSPRRFGKKLRKAGIADCIFRSAKSAGQNVCVSLRVSEANLSKLCGPRFNLISTTMTIPRPHFLSLRRAKPQNSHTLNKLPPHC